MAFNQELTCGLSWVDSLAVETHLGLRPEDTGWFVDPGGESAFAMAPCLERVVVFAPTFAQYALLSLKTAALYELPVQGARALLGVGPPGRRVWFYHYLRGRLPPEVRRWWDDREDQVRTGVLHAGAVEDRLARFRRRLGLLHLRPSPEQLLSAPVAPGGGPPAVQAWDGAAWRALLAWTLPGVVHALAGLWAQPKDGPLTVGRLELTERATRALAARGPAGRHLLQWWLLGDWPAAGDGPRWLTPEGYAACVGARDRIELRSGTTLDVARRGEPSPRLLDVGGMLSAPPPDRLGPLLTRLGEVAHPDAVLVSWAFGAYSPTFPATGWRRLEVGAITGGGPLDAGAVLLART